MFVSSSYKGIIVFVLLYFTLKFNLYISSLSIFITKLYNVSLYYVSICSL